MKAGPFKSKTLSKLWDKWELKRWESERVRLLSVDTEFILLEAENDFLNEENRRLEGENKLLKLANMQLNKTLLYVFEHRE